MSTLIDISTKIRNPWLVFDGDAAEIPADSHVLLPVEEWIERTRLWREHAGDVGILLEPTDDPQRLAPWLDELALVAVDFPKFTDGRGFSLARLLRTRLGFTKPVRAVGDVIADQVPLLKRCGFTQFELANEHQAEIALQLLASPLPTYQPAADGIRTIPLPGIRSADKTVLGADRHATI